MSPASASTLPTKTIARDAWSKALAEKLKPSCDADAGTRTADAHALASAGAVIVSWTEFTRTKGKSRTADGRTMGGGPEPTRMVDSVGLTCAAGASDVQINGATYPFDIAWVVSGRGKGPTLNGENGAGQFVMIQALSFKQQRIVFAKIFVPSDSNDDSDDTVVISSLEGFLPANPDEPIVRVVSDRENPKFETFLFSRSATDGISLQVPQQDPLGKGRYVSIARFGAAL